MFYKTIGGRTITFLGCDNATNIKVKNEEFKSINNLEELFKLLLNYGWTKDTVSNYYRDNYNREVNPTEGQCTITGILVQEIFGGNLREVKVGEGYHTFNEIDGVFYDLAKDQFDIKNINLDYTNTNLLNREELLSNEDINRRYNILKNNIINAINK